MARILGIGVALALASSVSLPAQQAKPAAAAPTKAADAKWVQPRTPDGQPDMQGVWGGAYAGRYTLTLESPAYLRTVGMPRGAGFTQSDSGEGGRPIIPPPASGIIDPPDGILPYQPWALERRLSVMKDYSYPAPWQMDNQTRGWPSGIPRENNYSSVDGAYGGPIQILQLPNYVLFLYETHHEFRIVPLDGRPHPGKDIKLWEGSSRGHWEGNTLVIDVANQNDSTRLTVIGDFHSDEIRVAERWTIIDKDTLQYHATITDPKVFTRPWTMANLYKRSPAGTQIFEYAGVEGEMNAAIGTEDAARREAEKAAAATEKK